MEERKEELRQIRKIAKKKTIIKTVILGVVVFVFLSLYLLVISIAGNMLFDFIKIMQFAKLLVWFLIMTVIVAILFGRYIIYDGEIKNETRKRSILYVEEKLSKNSRTEVKPIQTSARYYMFLTKEMPSIGKFYARLLGEKYVNIEFKLKGDAYYHFVENIEKEQFTYYYELIE